MHSKHLVIATVLVCATPAAASEMKMPYSFVMAEAMAACMNPVFRCATTQPRHVSGADNSVTALLLALSSPMQIGVPYSGTSVALHKGLASTSIPAKQHWEGVWKSLPLLGTMLISRKRPPKPTVSLACTARTMTWMRLVCLTMQYRLSRRPQENDVG